jgi:uncharacterized protein with GYD domain
MVMASYVLLTKISPESMSPVGKLEDLEKAVKEKVASACPEVRWTASYAVLGPYDYLDILEAPDDLTAWKVATIIRSFGHATTETWPAIPWDSYKQHVLGDLGARANGARRRGGRTTTPVGRRSGISSRR